MQMRIKNAAGLVVVVTGLPSLAQDASAGKAASSVGYAACPKECVVVTPPGPDFLIAFAAFGIGLVAGAALVKVLGSKTSR
jgi:hypothetical protein